MLEPVLAQSAPVTVPVVTSPPVKPAVTEKPKSVPGQHIFPATIIEPMAMEWKALTKENKHDEAMVLLEQIIKDSSPMFARLAQHEGYHHTVDVNTLVTAAQARVATWLIYWDPAKGRLFSWLSKSLSADAMVLLDTGITRRISEIVEQKLDVKVLSWNAETGKFVAKPITDWIKYPTESHDLWRKLTVFNHNEGHSVDLFVTGDHEMLTQRGWVEVDYLNAEDVIYVRFGTKFTIEAKCTVTKIADLPEGTGGDLSHRYDITIADTHNFVANGIVVHNCSKHVFLAEVVRTSNHRKRYYPTGDNLEKFAGAMDHGVVSNEAVENVQTRLKKIFIRWGDPQAICCLRYHVASIVECQGANKKHIVKSGSLASGLSADLSKFFYNWALFALRDAMYDIVERRIKFTRQEILRLRESYTFLPDLMNIVTLDQMNEIIVKLGGVRLKVPTTKELDNMEREHRIHRKLMESPGDPEGMIDVMVLENTREPDAEEVFDRLSHELVENREEENNLY